MSNELKPCPFCGTPELQKIMFCDDLIGWTYSLECEFCGARITSLADIDDAIRKWNTRPAEEALKAECKAQNCEICKHSYYVYGCEFNCTLLNNGKRCKFEAKAIR